MKQLLKLKKKKMLSESEKDIEHFRIIMKKR